MPESRIPRRSVLFMPATRHRAVEKAVGLPVDSIVLDLEDAVHPDQKTQAREFLRDHLQRQFGYRERLVRINAVDSRWWKEDIAALNDLPEGLIDGIVIPKVERQQDIDLVVRSLASSARANTSLWIMLETTHGVLRAEELCGYGQPVVAALVGTADLTRALRLPPDAGRTGLLPSLSHCVLSARAAGVDIIDGVFVSIEDSARLRRECEQGRLLGFDGKTLIHPNQLAIANEVFAPTRQEVEDAREMVEAFNAAIADGQGVCRWRNQLVEHLHAAQAGALLARHELLKKRDT